jgi:hypothetical protein
MSTKVYSLNELFEPMEQWIDIILKSFTKLELKVYRLDRQLIIDLLLYAYQHDSFKNIILTPWAFKMNYKELYHAYLQQWGK